MTTSLNNSYVGNFVSYSKEDIIKFLQKNYRIIAKSMNVFNNAMDNTVVDIDNQYVLKIYETKSFAFIKKALDNYERFKNFYSIELIKTFHNKNLSHFCSKPAIVYKKVQGSFSNTTLDIIYHISKFHQLGFSTFKQFKIDSFLFKIVEQIDLYFNIKVRKELKKRGRLDIYKSLIKKLSTIYIPKQIIILPYGFIHGDCAPNNFIRNNSNIYFLDFDCIRKDFQFLDIIDLLLKYSQEPKTDKDLTIIKTYLQNTGFYKTTRLKYFYYLVNILACFKGVLMALSTEYYCFEKKKFTPEVMDSLFLKHVLQLITNVELRLERLHCQERLHESTEEYMAILRAMIK